MESKRSVFFGMLFCVFGFAVGVIIGYCAIKRPTDSEKEDTKVIIPEYKKSCNAKCDDEAKMVKSCSPSLPRHYVAHHLNGKTITVDGRLDDDAWKDVPWTQNFTDLRGPQYPAPRVETKVKIRWDDELVYVGAYMEEPHVWATYEENDSEVYKDNDFEIFFDVDNSWTMYKQVLINAIGTTWDLMLDRAYVNGGSRWKWEGIREKGVYTDGVVNNANVSATFWSVELSLPFASLNENTTRTAVKPVDGEWWFMFLARARYDLDALPNGTYRKVNGSSATWLGWNPTGAVNNHLPNKWGMLFFETDPPGVAKQAIENKRWLTYQALYDVFTAVKMFKLQKDTYVDVLSELNLPPYVTSNSCLKSVQIQLLDYSVDVNANEGFQVTIESKSEPGVRGHISQDGYVIFTGST